jgi:hypothetical protein
MLSEGEKNTSLKVHEWLAIAVLIGILTGLACLTSLRGEASRLNLEYLPKKYSGFDVWLKGAVDHPGVYHIQSEMKMKEVLALAGVSQHADLRRFNMDSMIKKGRVINVPERAMINIRLEGAVKMNQTISIPKGSKVEDLRTMVEFLPEADPAFLKKKRRLKPGETLIVPSLNH